MKVRIARRNNFAVLGNRSPRYFGIDLFMDQSFFPKTSDGKHGSERPDPRIKGFCRTIQNHLRDRLNDAARKIGYTLEDADNEWMGIVKTSNKAATAKMMETGLGLSPDMPITKKDGGPILKAAFQAACRVAAGIVHEREIDPNSWEHTDSQQHFSLMDDQMLIYIIRDSPTSDFYKIGRTTNMQKRISSYKTHSHNPIVIQVYPERKGLNEQMIHDFFKHRRDSREFFLLTKDDLDLVCNPSAMANAIKNKIE